VQPEPNEPPPSPVASRYRYRYRRRRRRHRRQLCVVDRPASGENLLLRAENQRGRSLGGRERQSYGLNAPRDDGGGAGGEGEARSARSCAPCPLPPPPHPLAGRRVPSLCCSAASSRSFGIPSGRRMVPALRPSAGEIRPPRRWIQLDR